MLIYFIIFLAIISRFVPHMPNFAPITALAIFAAAYLPWKKAAGITFAARLISDIFLGFVSWPMMLAIYASHGVGILLGLWIKRGITVIPTESDVLKDERRNPLADEILIFKRSLHSDALSRDDKRGLIIAVDGKFTIPNLNVPQEAIIGGDNKVISIAAASIIAKVYRDELMCRLHKAHPLYNFAKHKGYGTAEHCEAIVKHGLSPLHRLTFCSRLLPLS